MDQPIVFSLEPGEYIQRLESLCMQQQRQILILQAQIENLLTHGQQQQIPKPSIVEDRTD